EPDAAVRGGCRPRHGDDRERRRRRGLHRIGGADRFASERRCHLDRAVVDPQSARSPSVRRPRGASLLRGRNRRAHADAPSARRHARGIEREPWCALALDAGPARENVPTAAIVFRWPPGGSPRGSRGRGGPRVPFRRRRDRHRHRPRRSKAPHGTRASSPGAIRRIAAAPLAPVRSRPPNASQPFYPNLRYRAGIPMAIRTWLDRFGRDVVRIDGPVKRDLDATRHFLANPNRPVFLPGLDGGPAAADLWSTRDRGPTALGIPPTQPLAKLTARRTHRCTPVLRGPSILTTHAEPLLLTCPLWWTAAPP